MTFRPRPTSLRALSQSFPNTPLTQLLRIRYPIIQAPMSPITPPGLVAAVSDAGGLGSIAAARMTPEQLRADIDAVRGLTSKPFAVNLFVPKKTAPYGADEVAKVRGALHRVHRRLRDEGVELPAALPPPAPPAYSHDAFAASTAAFERQAETLVNADVPVFSWTFGLPSAAILEECRRRGIVTVGTATTPQEAAALARSGLVDAIIVQGAEAGGHRGAFLTPDSVTPHRASIGLFSLLPLARMVVPQSIPLIAAGGVMDARGLVSAMLLGANGAQMGTRFMTARESTLLPAAHRRLLLQAEGIRQGAGEGREGGQEEVRGLLADSYRPTVLTRAFSGRAARGFYNDMVEAFNEEEGDVPPLPWEVQSSQVQPYARAAAVRGDTRWMQLWAGQSYPLCDEQSAAEIIGDITAEAKGILMD